MLGLDHREETDRTQRARAVALPFAGLDFELVGPASLCAAFVQAARDGAAGIAGTRALKFPVDCHVEVSRRPLLGEARDNEGRGPAPGIAWRWSENAGHVSTRFGHAHVEECGGRFSARLAVADGPHSPRFLLSGVSALILHRLGGGILHAASVELDSGVIAFVGPSGAGKSTACRHAEGSPLFSADTLAVVPARLGEAPGHTLWFAHPLPGGTRPVPDMPAAARRWLPLLGVLRVQRAGKEADATVAAPAPSRAGAVALLRESAFQLGVGSSAEEELLSRLEALARAVPVGRLHLRLGARVKPIVTAWLSTRAREAGWPPP